MPYVQEEMRRREREKMRSLQDFAFGMEDEEEEPPGSMPAAVPEAPGLPAVRRAVFGLPVPPMPTSTASWPHEDTGR